MILQENTILIRGAGELATGVAWCLTKAGYRVIMTEVEKPLMVRWPVCFGTAVEEGQWTVEGITSKRISKAQEAYKVWEDGAIPVLVDPSLNSLNDLKPSILVDAIIAKRNIGTTKNMAPLTIGLGPGFFAGEDVHLVVETQRGHNLGRLIYKGEAEPNTGIPGKIAGFDKERVIYSTQAGLFKAKRKMGETVNLGDCLGTIENTERIEPVLATIQGTLRGLLRDNTPVLAKVKVGDIDARGDQEYCFTLSEKARMIGSSVLLAVCEYKKI